jgi:hypothetical protein
MTYRIWIADRNNTANVFYEDYESYEEAEEKANRYAASGSFYVIEIEEVREE